MAVIQTRPGAEAWIAPTWPRQPVDPDRCYVSYHPPADELVVFFDGKPVPSYSNPLAAFAEHVAVMVDLAPDWASSTGEIVGIQGIPFVAGLLPDHPAWAPLAQADDGARREALARFLADVAAVFALHGTGDSAPDAPR